MAITALPPQPPRDLVPRPLLEGPMVQISDIRREPGRLTEAEAREELSDFAIFRFERAGQATDRDGDGERVRPTWANVVRTEVRGISKREAARQVRALHDVHKSLGEKKASLNDAQQRQLEKVLEELEMREVDRRYHYVLVQIDRKLRDKKWRDTSRDGGEVRAGDRKHRERTRRYSENRGRRENIEIVDFFGRRRSVVREPRKKVKETVSITAYYKRCPKPDVDAVAMLYQRDAQNARQLEPPHPQHTFGPQQNQILPYNGNMAMGLMGTGMGMGMAPPQGNRPAIMAHPNMKMGNKVNGNRPQVQVIPNRQNGNNAPRRKPSPHQPRHPRSPASSRESMYSDTDTSSDSDSNSVLTPDSSHSSHSHPKPRRLSSSPTQHRRGSRYVEEPAHFGIPPRTMTPHKQRRHDEHRIADEFLPARHHPAPPPPPPSPPTLSLDLEQLQANAYAAGRADERVERAAAGVAGLRPLPRVVQQQYLPRRSAPAEGFLFEDDEDEDAAAAFCLPLRPRGWPRRSGVRLVRPGDVGIEDEVVEGLERVRFEDDVSGRYRDELAGRYAGEYYEDVVPRGERRRVEEARGGLRRADGEGDVLYEREAVDPLNPFSPRPRVMRRATVGFGPREYV